MEMVKIMYSDYDKIIDTCMFLAQNYVLKFYVELYKKSIKRGRTPFHHEVGYDTGDGFRVNINRDFNYYLAIESMARGDTGEKSQVRIYVNDIYFLKTKLHDALNWFMGDKVIFAKKNNQIIIPTRPDSIVVGLSFDKYIELEPGVITMNQEQFIGVKVYMSNDATGFFMDVNTFLSFVYFIDNFNMFQSAQLMLAYIGAPEPGANYYGIGGVGDTSAPKRISPLKIGDDLNNSGMKPAQSHYKNKSFIQLTNGQNRKDE